MVSHILCAGSRIRIPHGCIYPESHGERGLVRGTGYGCARDSGGKRPEYAAHLILSKEF